MTTYTPAASGEYITAGNDARIFLSLPLPQLQLAVNMLLFLSLSLASCAFATRIVKRAPDNVPEFVVKYAPIVYLHSEDPYKPSDIAAQLANTEPKVKFEVVGNGPYTLDNLADLNALGGKDVYLTSKVKADLKPEYFHGVLPDSDGKTDGAVSCAIIVNDHGDGTVDAFYFYFDAFDRGPLDIGNHVGDWEHSMIRFVNGEPDALWYSQHSNGQAFKYSTVHKYDDGADSLRVSIPRAIMVSNIIKLILPSSPSSTAPTALTQTTPPQELTRTASPTSTCPRASSKTTRTKDHDGIPRCPLIGIHTTTRLKLSLLTTPSKSSPLFVHILSTHTDGAHTGIRSIGFLSLAAGATSNIRTMTRVSRVF